MIAALAVITAAAGVAGVVARYFLPKTATFLRNNISTPFN